MDYSDEREINVQYKIPLEKAKLLGNPDAWAWSNVDDAHADLMVIYKLAIVNDKDPKALGEAVLRILGNRIREAAETAVDCPKHRLPYAGIAGMNKINNIAARIVG